MASDKQADDVMLLDARQSCSYTDYIVICSGETDRQIEAIQNEILEDLRKQAVVPYRSEGNPESGWILIDYRGVIVHIFSRQMRAYYNLESIYEKAPCILRIQ